MVKFQWADGFRPPTGVTAQEVGEVIASLREPSPLLLLEASKFDNHPLHHAIWGEPDETWAERGRIEFCRKIISGLRRVDVISRIDVVTRPYEFVAGSWHAQEDIMACPALSKAYMADMIRSMEQITAKMRRWEFVISNKD
jgi:hypothetical protein